MSISTEITKSSEMKFDGKVIKVTYDIADVNGNDAWREVVHHPGATAIVAVTEDNKPGGQLKIQKKLLSGIRKPQNKVMPEHSAIQDIVTIMAMEQLKILKKL